MRYLTCQVWPPVSKEQRLQTNSQTKLCQKVMTINNTEQQIFCVLFYGIKVFRQIIKYLHKKSACSRYDVD